MALTPLFTRADVKAEVDAYFERLLTATIEALRDVGEKFITDARNLRTYKDQTGNLRSSIGYLILARGKIIESVFDAASSPEGKQIGRAYAEKLARQFRSERLVLIGVAGMDYAVYVESKGFDVITGSSNEAKKLLQRHLKRITKS